MSEARVARRSAEKEPPTLELVLKRNSVERIKREKDPLGMLAELPALIAAGYESVPEEDLVRLKWWGLYHDKPKIGTFMLRIKLPAGRVTPAQLRAVGELSLQYGKTRGRALDAADDSAPLPRARVAAGGVPPPRRGRTDDRRRVRRRGPQRDRLPRRGPRARRAVRRHRRSPRP